MQNNVICGGEFLLARRDPGRLAKNLQTIWHESIPRGEINPRVRMPIRESWQRCKGRGVSPSLDVAPQVLRYDEYERRRRRFCSLLKATNAIGSLESFCDLSRFIMAIADEEGVLLEVAGHPTLLDQVSRKNFVVGANWSEDVTGTNAIGTALQDGRTTVVFSAEHFCQGWHHYACVASPVRDTASGKILGAVNITTIFEQFQPHTKLLVENIARILELEISHRREKDDLLLHQNAMSAMMDNLSEGVVVVDNDERIRRVNIKRIGLECLHELQSVHMGVRRLRDLPAFKQLRDMPNLVAPEERLLECGLKVRIAPVRRGDDYLGSVIFINPGRPKALPGSAKGPEVQGPMPVGRSAVFGEVLRRAREIAQYDCNLFIHGETGVGKSLMAAYVHSHSPRHKGPFLAVNCGALPSQLTASELFGYESGAFTGARRKGHAGKFEAAHGGTILLDEISELSLEAQATLLQVLEEKQLTPLGSNKPQAVDVRVIAATNKPLDQAVREGSFRKDLYYRINVVSLELPPLRERLEDIEALAEHFVTLLGKRMAKSVSGFSDEARRLLLSYPWPGNIRELKNALEHAMIFCGPSGVLGVDVLPEHLRQGPARQAARPSLAGENGPMMLSSVMHTCDGNISRMAQMIGVSRPTIYKWLKRYNLDQEPKRSSARP